jgi:hypothetical protein
LSDTYFNDEFIVCDVIASVNEISFEFLDYLDEKAFLTLDVSQYDEDLFEKEKSNEFKESILLFELYMGFLHKVFSKNVAMTKFLQPQIFLSSLHKALDFLFQLETSLAKKQHKWILHYEKGHVSYLHQVFQTLYTILTNLLCMRRFGVIDLHVIEKIDTLEKIKSFSIHPLIQGRITGLWNDKILFDPFLTTALYAEECNQ